MLTSAASIKVTTRPGFIGDRERRREERGGRDREREREIKTSG